MNHLNANKWLSNRQYGFRKGRSTMLQVLKVLDDWTNSLEKGRQINVIYTDFEKAFDKVPYKRLVEKPKRIWSTGGSAELDSGFPGG
jgi:hypothetical protein